MLELLCVVLFVLKGLIFLFACHSEASTLSQINGCVLHRLIYMNYAGVNSASTSCSGLGRERALEINNHDKFIASTRHLSSRNGQIHTGMPRRSETHYTALSHRRVDSRNRTSTWRREQSYCMLNTTQSSYIRKLERLKGENKQNQKQTSKQSKNKQKQTNKETKTNKSKQKQTETKEQADKRKKTKHKQIKKQKQKQTNTKNHANKNKQASKNSSIVPYNTFSITYFLSLFEQKTNKQSNKQRNKALPES